MYPTRLAIVAALTTAVIGCISERLPSNRSVVDPSDAKSADAVSARYRPSLIANTRVFLDPSVGEGAQKMDHSSMQGMDHSKMQGMGGMDGSKMKGTEGMQGMDHSKMQGMKPDSQPTTAGQNATADEMKKTADEMKRISEELKKKSDALKKDRAQPPSATPAATPAKPEDHSKHE